MSIPILPRTPAHSGFRPALPEFAPAPEQLAQAVRAVMGAPGEVLKKLPGDTEPGGYYLFAETNGRRYFLKVVENEYRERQNQAESIARALKAADVPVNASLDGFPRPWGTTHAVFAYPYVAARFAATAEADMCALGALVAAMHGAMAALSPAQTILAQARRRHEHVRDIRAAVKAGTFAPPFQAARLDGLLEPDCTALLFDPHGQPIHGDLNYGNALFPLDGGAPLILDFEDAMLSFGSPWIDIALVLERFVLIDVPDDAAARGLGGAFLEAYLRHAPGPLRQPRPLHDILAGTAQRSICLLAEMAGTGRSVAAAEWEKFAFLRDQADARAGLLAEFDRTIRAHAPIRLT